MTIFFQNKDWRYITQGVWMRETYFQRLWIRFLRVPKLLKGETAWNKMTKFFELYCDICFMGGKGGLEIMNFYKLNPHPLTHKKEQCLHSEYKSCLNLVLNFISSFDLVQ
jgi:hypothetical protein